MTAGTSHRGTAVATGSRSRQLWQVPNDAHEISARHPFSTRDPCCRVASPASAYSPARLAYPRARAPLRRVPMDRMAHARARVALLATFPARGPHCVQSDRARPGRPTSSGELRPSTPVFGLITNRSCKPLSGRYYREHSDGVDRRFSRGRQGPRTPGDFDCFIPRCPRGFKTTKILPLELIQAQSWIAGGHVRLPKSVSEVGKAS